MALQKHENIHWIYQNSRIRKVILKLLGKTPFFSKPTSRAKKGLFNCFSPFPSATKNTPSRTSKITKNHPPKEKNSLLYGNREKFKKWGGWKDSKTVDQKTSNLRIARFSLYIKGFGALCSAEWNPKICWEINPSPPSKNGLFNFLFNVSICTYWEMVEAT